MGKKGVGRKGAPCKHGVSAHGYCAKKATMGRSVAMKARWAAIRASGKACKHGARTAAGYCPKAKRMNKGSYHGPINYSQKVKAASRLARLM